MLLFLSFPDNYTHILPHGIGPPLIIMGSTWISLFWKGKRYTEATNASCTGIYS